MQESCTISSAIMSKLNHLRIDTNESHLKLSDSSSMPRSSDGAKIRISGAIHDERRLN